MKAWTLVLLAVALGCSSAKRPRQPEPGEPTLSVLSYNLNYGMAGDTETLGVIRDADADLVVLQETSPEWEAAIRAELSERYPHMAFRHCCLAGGLAVLSKLSFEEQQYLKSEAGWFPAWRLIVDSQLGKVQFLNVHLRPQVSDSGSVLSGYFTTPAVRAEEIQQYHAALQQGLPTIVAGDFNENVSGRAVRYLHERGFRSALPQFDPGADTWRWHTSIGTVHAQLDHIVYDAELEPLSARVLLRGRSDHYALLATFGRAPPRAAGDVGVNTCGSSLSGC